MANVTVTAENGHRCQVRVQKLETHTNKIPAVRNSAGELLSPEREEQFKSYVDDKIEVMGSESRRYEVGPTTRLMIEEHPPV